jgi:hypothetical protein
MLCNFRTIQDPASQRLTWYKPPLTVLVIKKVRDVSVLQPFVQLVKWLIEVSVTDNEIYYRVASPSDCRYTWMYQVHWTALVICRRWRNWLDRSHALVRLQANSHLPCRFPAAVIHTCHTAPLPFSDSAVSFVKVRVVDGNIRTASPATTFYSNNLRGTPRGSRKKPNAGRSPTCRL